MHRQEGGNNATGNTEEQSTEAGAFDIRGSCDDGGDRGKVRPRLEAER